MRYWLGLPTCTWCMAERATKEGAVAGILGGLISGTAYLIYVGPKFMANTPWLGIDHKIWYHRGISKLSCNGCSNQ